MNNQTENNSPESPPEPEDPQLSETQEQDPENPELEKDQEGAPEKQPPSKFVRLLRKILIGFAIAAAIFFAGFLTNHFVRTVPLSKELESARSELDQANETLSDLQDENDRLDSANQDAEDKIDALEAELTAAQANLSFYQVLVNVNTARIELFLEDIESAQIALINTQDNLDALLPFIEDVNSELALSLPRRLDLIIAGLERDPETALIDLELLTKDLLALEPLLTGD